MVERSEVGAWVVKGDPSVWDYFGALEASTERPLERHAFPSTWTLGRTSRNKLIEEGDLIALWITGSDRPGIHEVGWVTSTAYEVRGMGEEFAVDRERAAAARWAVDYAAVRLGADYAARPELKADPVLRGCEHFRAPQMSNPTYLTVDEAAALARLLDQRLPADVLEASRWSNLL